MLHIKHKHHISLPTLGHSTKAVAFEPVTTDSDELTNAIDNARTDRDDTWQLSERPDMGELTEFWNTVEADVANDPTWFKFSNEE